MSAVLNRPVCIEYWRSGERCSDFTTPEQPQTDITGCEFHYRPPVQKIPPDPAFRKPVKSIENRSSRCISHSLMRDEKHATPGSEQLRAVPVPLFQMKPGRTATPR